MDEIRARRGDWRSSSYEAGLWAREVALTSACGHLESGRDVVVPQYVARVAFLDQLAGVAGETGAAFHELCLWDSREASLARFDQRASDPSLAAHHRDCLEQAGGLPGISAMYDDLLAFLGSRANAVVISTQAGDQATALVSVLAATQ